MDPPRVHHPHQRRHLRARHAAVGLRQAPSSVNSAALLRDGLRPPLTPPPRRAKRPLRGSRGGVGDGLAVLPG
jgi:hypothetical protein